jgi:multiple antibiotic resistance protein
LEHLFVSIGVAFAALFPIVDPIGAVPAFLGLTQKMDRDERRAQALKAVVAALAIMTVFLAIGHFILDYFEISLAAVEVVGGLVLGYMGWQMLTQPIEPPDPEEHGSDTDIYFSPMAFPLLAGPGALAVVLAFSNRADNWLDFPGFLIGIVLILAVTYLILVHADRVLGLLGPKGVDVMNRVMGLIVLLIAAELVFNGVADEFGLETFGN